MSYWCFGYSTISTTNAGAFSPLWCGLDMMRPEQFRRLLALLIPRYSLSDRTLKANQAAEVFKVARHDNHHLLTFPTLNLFVLMNWKILRFTGSSQPEVVWKFSQSGTLWVSFKTREKTQRLYGSVK